MTIIFSGGEEKRAMANLLQAQPGSFDYGSRDEEGVLFI
jgi:hypothetical protein